MTLTLMLMLSSLNSEVISFGDDVIVLELSCKIEHNSTMMMIMIMMMIMVVVVTICFVI